MDYVAKQVLVLSPYKLFHNSSDFSPGGGTERYARTKAGWVSLIMEQGLGRGLSWTGLKSHELREDM